MDPVATFAIIFAGVVFLVFLLFAVTFVRG
jgi:hypothetical protein